MGSVLAEDAQICMVHSLVYAACSAAAEALNAGRDIFDKARRLLPSLPVGRSTPPPATLGDAQALVQQKQEAAQQQHKEPKQKQKGVKEAPAADQAFPGARIGSANDNSAYWTLVEVGMAHRHCSLAAKALQPTTASSFAAAVQHSCLCQQLLCVCCLLCFGLLLRGCTVYQPAIKASKLAVAVAAPIPTAPFAHVCGRALSWCQR
jgi:hypothetical protein